MNKARKMSNFQEYQTHFGDAKLSFVLSWWF